MHRVGKAAYFSIAMVIAAGLGACSPPATQNGSNSRPTFRSQPADAQSPDPAAGHWDMEPKDIEAAALTPLSRCTLFWMGIDGASFGQLATGAGIFFVLAKSGVTFPELTPYQAVLSSPAGHLTFSMRPEAGRSLSVLVSFENDPGGVMLRVLNAGFRITATGQSAGLILDETASPVSFIDQLRNSTCLGMNQAAARRHWANPPVMHTQ